MITSDRADAMFRGAVPRVASVPEWTPIQNKRCLRETSAEIKAPSRSFLFGRFFSVASPFHEFLTVNLSLALHLSALSLISGENYQKRARADILLGSDVTRCNVFCQYEGKSMYYY